MSPTFAIDRRRFSADASRHVHRDVGRGRTREASVVLGRRFFSCVENGTRHRGTLLASSFLFTRSVVPMYFKTRSLVSVISAFVLALSPLAHADTLNQILQKKVLRVGVPTDFPPYGIVDATMKPIGADIDAARYVAKKLNVEVELVPVTSPNRIPYLLTNKVDLIVSSFGKTPERENVVGFTTSYSPFFSAIYASKSLPLKSVADLAGKSVAVTRGTLQDEALAKLGQKDLVVRRFEDDASTIAAFVSQQLPLLATSAAVAGSVMNKNPQLNAEYKLLLTNSPCYMALRKEDTDLKEAINKILVAGKANGDLDAISTRWLGRPLGQLPD